MNKYIYQFYNEGFATTFYLKPTNFVKKHIKNKKQVIIINLIIKIIYTISAVLFAIYMFKVYFPFL